MLLRWVPSLQREFRLKHWRADPWSAAGPLASLHDVSSTERLARGPAADPGVHPPSFYCVFRQALFERLGYVGVDNAVLAIIAFVDHTSEFVEQMDGGAIAGGDTESRAH